MAGSIDIIIVNWNAAHQLGQCLESISAASRNGVELRRTVVVDNASSDSSMDAVKTTALPITVIRNAENRGFAAACNQAAAASDARYILFLNPDTRLRRDSLVTPVQFLERPENHRIGIVGIQLLNDRGQVTPTCARFLTPGMIVRRMIGLERLTRALWLPHFMADWDHQTSRNVDHVMGAFFLVRQELFRRLGGFDERFFVYLEDLDFSLRAKQAGFDSFFLADSQVYHKGGGVSEQIKATRLYYALTSRVLYGYKHFNRWTATFLMLGTFFVEPFTRVAGAALRGSRALLAHTMKAYALLWRALPPGGTDHSTVATRHRLPQRQWNSPGPPPVFCPDLAPCPVCETPPSEQGLLFVKQLASFVRCRHCGFVFISPRPTTAWLASRYDYYAAEYFTDRSKLASDFNTTRHDVELNLLRGSKGTLLDVGCATGSFVAAARAAGFDARGIDISSESTHYGREVLGLPLDVGDLWERCYPPETFSVLTLWATLEHLVDPNRFLSEAYRLLVPQGRLALTVPNHASLAQKVLGKRNRYVGIDHVNYFTASTLRRLLSRHGFRAETTRTDRFSPVVFWQDLLGRGSDGASVERQLADQVVTDRFKYGHGMVSAARVAHAVLTKALSTAGLGDLLYLVARKPATE